MNKEKILYVDDEQLNLTLFGINFKKKYDVITAISGKQALDFLENNADINIVISDMKMPQMTGLEFINIAKKKYPNTSFYILTGFDITNEISEALNNKLINKYFQKPFNYKEIDNAIQKILR